MGKRAKRDTYGKSCPRCGEHKPWSEYGSNRSTRDQHQAYCRPCMKLYSREYEAAHKEVRKAREEIRKANNAEKLARPASGVETKVCFKCKHRKPLLQFYRVSKNRDGRHSWCVECCRAGQREWNANNKETLKRQNARRSPVSRTPEQQAVYYRRHRLRYYGLTEQQYDDLVAAQSGVCAICGLPPQAEHTRLRIDHDHETGMVRGLLCIKCNSALGMLQDDPGLVEKALSYMRNTPVSQLAERG